MLVILSLENGRRWPLRHRVGVCCQGTAEGTGQGSGTRLWGGGVRLSSVVLVCPAWEKGLPQHSQLVVRNGLVLLKLRLAGGRGYAGIRVCSASEFTPLPPAIQG